MKKFIFILLFLVITILLLRSQYISNKSKDMIYAIERYSMKSMHNSHKLIKIKEIYIDFKDEYVSVVTVTGIDKNNNELKYNLLLKKNKKSVWKIIEQYDLKTLSLTK
ncbi:hypothetical protein [Oceanirhabdus sp. W0125-5]|uniref:hypothetical protein n=1 Tax=Oceanirhabdus sp. W0125-5 TaxID=2999116 RepID=UPI0022F2B115|nr:hypothetical protein [Oceanirhabdus sp. W0125-5]WBW98684.1 hypothetical protein OW730_07975 [Oceanirhabdus sp. W0125-5]